MEIPSPTLYRHFSELKWHMTLQHTVPAVCPCYLWPSFVNVSVLLTFTCVSVQCLWPLECSIPNPLPQVSCPERLMSFQTPLKRNSYRQFRRKPTCPQRCGVHVVSWCASLGLQLLFSSPMSVLSLQLFLIHLASHRSQEMCFLLPLVSWTCTSYEPQIVFSEKENSMLAFLLH